MALLPQIQLLTPLPGASQKDLDRLEAWISANSSEAAIQQLFILVDSLDPDIQRELEQRYSKLRFIPSHQRPDFADLVQTAIDHGMPDRITIICDSNIWLDLQHSDLVSLLSTLERYPCLCFSLTRRQSSQPNRLFSTNGMLPDFYSSDAWIFAGLPQHFSIRGIYLEDEDRERLIHASLQLEGYRIANACNWLRGCELESSTKVVRMPKAELAVHSPPIDSPFTILGEPQCQMILPPCHGALDPKTPLSLEKLNVPGDTFSRRWILVDLRHSSHGDCQLSLLWLLFLSLNQNRCLAAYISMETDPAIVEVLDHFHQLTGRSLCIEGFGIDALMEHGVTGDVCWVSSPAVIGPELLRDPLPLVCLSCEEESPIKSSWLDQHNLRKLFDQLRSLEPIDAPGTRRLTQPESITSFQIQLMTCTYRAEGFVQTFLAHSSDWISTTAAYGLSVLHTFFDVERGLVPRRKLLAALRQRKGFFLELKNDPGLYGAWNLLIQRSEEEFISNANPDDCRSPDQLGQLVSGLQAHPERMVASSVVIPIYRRHQLSWSFTRISNRCRQRWFEDVEDGYGLSRLYQEPNGPLGPIEPHNVPHCSPVWRRKIHVLHGLFDEQRYGSQADWGLWCKYAFVGGRFCHSDAPLSGYFINASSYGRKKQSNRGFERIVADFLRPERPLTSSEPTSRPPSLTILEPGLKQICIHGIDFYYGDHRISNNTILQSLADLHSNESQLKFIWFVEGYFIWGENKGERRSSDFKAIQQPWFGVLHIPPLTPKWAGNQFGELFFLKEWKESLRHCRALISLSAYMARDLRLIYPRIPIFNLKHPIITFAEKFDLKAFLADPKVVLVGYWLRRHHRFYRWRAPLKKVHLMKKYTPDHMASEEQVFGSLKPEEQASVEKHLFLLAEDYDQLLRTSLVYLSLYETSGNNSVIECISMGTPFIADRHPAIEEYVGGNYPLLLEPGELETLTQAELLSRTSEAHHYLNSHPSLAADLSYKRFREHLSGIIEML
jgi:hypothetical protein